MTFTVRSDAEGWLSRERQLIERQEWTPPAHRKAERKAMVTLGQCAETWLSQRTLKHTTRLHYRRILAHFAPLDDVPLEGLTPQRVREWHATTLVNRPTYPRSCLRAAPCRLCHGGQRWAADHQPVPDRAGHAGPPQAATGHPEHRRAGPGGRGDGAALPGSGADHCVVWPALGGGHGVAPQGYWTGIIQQISLFGYAGLWTCRSPVRPAAANLSTTILYQLTLRSPEHRAGS